MLQQYLPFTVLKHFRASPSSRLFQVATVLTVYGIETDKRVSQGFYREWVWLQQYLPFTVLKQAMPAYNYSLTHVRLQQYLPFTVLKP